MRAKNIHKAGYIYPGPRLLNPNCTCGDCSRLRIGKGEQEGFCDEAKEALIMEGWPHMTVLIEPHMSAETCPMFEDRRPQYGPDEAACDKYHARRDEQMEGWQE